MKLKKLAKVLEDTREVSMQEIIFRLFGYSMCLSSRKCKFIQTQPPKQRDGLMKPNIKNLKEDESIVFPNIIDYYQNRPDSLEDISLYCSNCTVLYCTDVYCNVLYFTIFPHSGLYTILYCWMYLLILIMSLYLLSGGV